ncbi:MAG: acetolactate decarboxylase [Bacteroidota bacterium]
MKVVLSIVFILIAWTNTAQVVHTAGMAKNVMKGIDLSPHIELDSVSKNQLFLLGPAEDLQGEITVIDGKLRKSSIEKGEIVTTDDFVQKLPFAVYAYVNNWSEKHLMVEWNSLKDIENEMASYAEEYQVGEAFPFIIEAKYDALTFHIIMRDLEEKEHSHESHKKAKVKFDRANKRAQFLGFYSTQHEGVFTHKGQFIHLHYLDETAQETGHVDELSINGLVKLKLPQSVFKK